MQREHIRITHSGVESIISQNAISLIIAKTTRVKSRGVRRLSGKRLGGETSLGETSFYHSFNTTFKI